MAHRIFVDANVLYKRTVRDWLFLLRNELPGMFQVHSSQDVIVESQRVWRKEHPKASGQSAERFLKMITSNLDEVITDFTSEHNFGGTDIHDYHVHAACVDGAADILLTCDVSDFGDPENLPYEIHTPDSFFCLVNESAPEPVRRVTSIQNTYWQDKKREGLKVLSLSEALRRNECPMFANIITGHLKVLAGAERPQPKDHLPKQKR